MSEVCVLVPVLGRPWRVEMVRDSVRDSEREAALAVVFVASSTDREEVEALEVAGVRHIEVEGPPAPGDYARKINAAIEETSEEWLFLGADDLSFQSGWADEALRVARLQQRRVIGTNDLGNRAVVKGLHSTHSLVARTYVDERGTIDQPGIALHEGYDHQFVDNEFIETARHRGEFAFAARSIVEHLHPHWRKAMMDSTYERALRGYRADQALFRARRRKWAGGHRVVSRRIRR